MNITNMMKKLISTVLFIGFCLISISSAQAAKIDLVNLMVNETGMQRISYEELLAENVDLRGLRHKSFSLRSNGEVVAIRTQGRIKQRNNKRTNKFGPGGYIEFYGVAADSLYTETRAYTLSFGGDRLDFHVNKHARYNENRPASQQYIQTKVVEEDIYYDYLAPSKTDPWHYGLMIAFTDGDTAGTAIDFELDNLVGNTAELDVDVYGVVDIKSEGNDHHFVAKVNGAEVGDQQFDGNVPSTLKIENVGVNEGSNQFQVFLRSIADTPFDAMGLNKLTLRYSRKTTTDTDYLEGQFNDRQVIVEGFNNAAPNVYRLGSNGNVTKIENVSEQGTGFGFSTKEKGKGKSKSFAVVADNGYKKPSVSAINDQVDIRSGSAEYLIIAHRDFIGSELDELVQIRSADYSVKVVDVAQVYSQFGNHLPNAEAIHNYIKYAVANLDTRFVTLVGSDTYDYKKLVSESISYVPTMYAETPGGELFIRQTPSDASYGDLDGDDIPDVPVGRLSVRTNAELAIVVEKIRDYQAREGYAGRILIAADQEDVGNGVSFTSDVHDLIDAIPSDWSGAIRSDFRAIPDQDGGQLAHDKIIAAINAGVSVTAYIGHSSVLQWSRTTPPMFKSTEIAGLTNIDKPTLVTQWGCWNTYFVDPGGNSMADKFLVGGLNGAVTVLGASTLTTSEGERMLGIELNKRMYQEGVTIGEAVIAAKQALALDKPDATDILLGWQIIGDPALVVNP